MPAAGVKMPALMVQVLEDEWTRNPEDARKTFDLLGSKEKELFSPACGPRCANGWLSTAATTR